MKLTTVVLACACAATACTAPEAPVDRTPGTWERYDDLGRVVDQLTLAEDGTFQSRNVWGPGPVRIGGDYSHAWGTYEVFDVRLHMQGETEDGFSFELWTTMFADDTRLALAPYVPDGDGVYHAIYDRRTPGYSGAFDWVMRPTLFVHDVSFLVDWIDPIWGTKKVDGGDVDLSADGSQLLVQYDLVRCSELTEGGAIACDDSPRLFIGLAFDPVAAFDVGMIYQRVQPVL
jgi:hypothetical protein